MFRVCCILMGALLVQSAITACGSSASNDAGQEPVLEDGGEGNAINLIVRTSFGNDPGRGEVSFSALDSTWSGSALTRYTWNLGDGSAPKQGAVITHVYPASGVYVYSLEGCNEAGDCDTSSGTIEMALNTTQIDLSRSSNFFGVAPFNAYFDASASSDPDGIESYAWYFGEELLSAEAAFNKQFGAGNYPIRLVITNKRGRVTEKSVVLQVEALRQDRRAQDDQKYLVRKETSNASNADVYLQRMLQPLPGEPVDTQRSTFAQWYAANSFPGEQWTNARYFNGGDLGFGRDMYCIGSEVLGRVSCFTTNYGNLGSDGTDIHQSLLGIEAGEFPFATVAMEFVANAPEGETVRFFAYLANPAPDLSMNPAMDFEARLNRLDGPAVSQVELDSEGIKNLPGACIVCHGGKVDPENVLHVQNQIVTGSGFLPFDAEVFSYLDANNKPVKIVETVYDNESNEYITVDTAAINDPRVKTQIAEIAKNNALVVLQHTLDARAKNPDISDETIMLQRPIVEYLKNTPLRHGGLADVDAKPYVPAGFLGREPVYDNIIKPYCRGCHFSQYGEDEYDLKAYVPNYSLFGCVDDLLMPHAELTDRHFLLRSNQKVVQHTLSRQPETEDFICNPQRVIDAMPINPAQANIPRRFSFNDRTGLFFEFETPEGEVPLLIEPLDSVNRQEKVLRVSEVVPVVAGTYSTQITADFDAGFIKLDVNIATLQNVDIARVLLDNIPLQQYSGNINLKQQTFPVTAGRHTLRLEYIKVDQGSLANTVQFDNLELPLTFINNQDNEAVFSFEGLEQKDIDPQQLLPVGFSTPVTAVNGFVLSDKNPLADNFSLQANGSGAEIQTTQRMGRGDLVFAYRVAASPVVNYLYLLINGQAVAEYASGMSGNARIQLPEGVHTLTWRYIENARPLNEANKGADIDQIRFALPSNSL